MNKNQKKITNNWLILILTVLVSFTVLSSFMFVSNVQYTRASRENFDSLIKDQLKTFVKNEIDNRYRDIEYSLDRLYIQERLKIKEKINAIAITLNNDYSNSNITLEERRKLLVKSLESIDNDDEDYLYFAITPDGVTMRSGTDNNLAGTKILDLVDKDGVRFIQEMTKAVDEKEGVYVTYHWPKEKDGEPLKKTSYCKYLPEFDMIIATGSYEEDVEKLLKARTFSTIQQYYTSSTQYISIVDYDGNMLVHPNKDLIGKSTLNLVNNDGEVLHYMFMKELEDDGEGFVSYYFNLPESDIISGKITYFRKLDRWNAYMGMGFYVDDVEDRLQAYTQELIQQHYIDLLITILLFIISAILIFILIRRGLGLQKNYLNQEEIVYTKLFKLSKDGIIILDYYGAVLYKNAFVNHILGNSLNQYINGKGELTFANVKENVYQIDISEDAIFYVTIIKEDIVYHGMDSYIYFITNITDQYEERNELEKQASYDMLTGLPNRRRLILDFEDLRQHLPDFQTVTIAMIDIDYFKIVNDTYGHETGDEVLILLGKCFNQRLHHADKIYRYGGEEFVVVLYNTSSVDTGNILSQINIIFTQLAEKMIDQTITFSAGIFTQQIHDTDIEINDLIHEADGLLYKAKENGRNRIEIE